MFIMGPELGEAFTADNVPTAKLLNWMEERGLRMDQVQGIHIRDKKYVIGVIGSQNLDSLGNPLFDLPNQKRCILYLGCPKGSNMICYGCNSGQQLYCRGKY